MLATCARTFNTVLQFSRRCRSKVTAGAVRLQQRARLVYDSFTETRVEGIAHVDPRLMCARAACAHKAAQHCNLPLQLLPSYHSQLVRQPGVRHVTRGT